MNSPPRVIVALDFAEESQVHRLVANLDPGTCRLKVGKELFTRTGPALVSRLVKQGFDVFLDLKFHDIPTTTAKACAAAADLGVWMINVHALGGRAMLEAARHSLESLSRRPLLVAVTVLTSLNEQAVAEIGLTGTVADNVLRLSRLTADTGLDGVVCSPREARALHATHGGGFILVTPGIRLPGAPADDQSRTLSPAEAVANGADYLVVGRPITGARDPLAALRAIQSDMDAADGVDRP